jgi:tRNA1Val (adenine37-N6)-methyltransferase
MENIPDGCELHELFDGKLRIFQKKGGYRFSVDTILLAGFAVKKASGTIADIGTGSGVLPVLLAKHKKFTSITGIEIQEDLASLAKKNIIFNKCDDRVKIIHADIKKIKKCFPPEKFDAVITNPPFYPAGSGKINPDKQNAIARHEVHGTLHDFISGSAFLLKQTGKFFAVYSAARVVDIITELRHRNIEPKALQFVHGMKDAPASMVLIEGVKGAGTEAKTLPPLILYDSEGNYTAQAKSFFDAV